MFALIFSPKDNAVVSRVVVRISIPNFRTARVIPCNPEVKFSATPSISISKRDATSVDILVMPNAMALAASVGASTAEAN